MVHGFNAVTFHSSLIAAIEILEKFDDQLHKTVKFGGLMLLVLRKNKFEEVIDKRNFFNSN